MNAKPYYVVIPPENEEHERLRSIFAIGAIAFLFYFRQVHGGIPFPLIPGRPDITSDTVMAFWGAYVVGMAISLVSRKFPATTPGRLVVVILTIVYVFSQAMYIWATFLLLIYFVMYFVIPALYPIDLGFYGVLAILVLLVILISRKTRLRVRKESNGLEKN